MANTHGKASRGLMRFAACSMHMPASAQTLSKRLGKPGAKHNKRFRQPATRKIL
jgi:hypothetical protein